MRILEEGVFLFTSAKLFTMIGIGRASRVHLFNESKCIFVVCRVGWMGVFVKMCNCVP